MTMRPGNAGYLDQAQKSSVLSESIADILVPVSALVACVIGAILVQLYAGLALRGVYADGAFFVTQILAGHGVVIMQPARLMSEMIYEWPVVLAMRLGVRTAHGVALVFSVVTNVLPGLIILLCLATIPSGRRCLFIFPAFVYFAGILSAQFASVTEGLVATSFFWLLFCLITLGRLTLPRLTLITALSIASLHLHEEMVFLGPILIAGCVFRWRHDQRSLPRIVLCAAALCALTSALIGGNRVLHQSPDRRKRMLLSRTFSVFSGYTHRTRGSILRASWGSWPLIASPRRCVSTVIENPTWTDWQPYTVSNVATMPKLPGVTYTYLLPPDRQMMACQAPADAAQTAP